MIIFSTPTELDMTALTTFGLSAKETDSPIGRFGTGLKYAIAVLMREGAEVTIYSGLRKLRIEMQDRAFRGKEYKAIVCVPESEPPFDLPFTADLGRDWELWQAFRELHSNTIDEGGATKRDVSIKAAPERTSIAVAHADFEAVFDDRAEIIIEDAPLWENDDLAIYPGESEFMFYRGIRARKLQHKSAFRYSIKTEIDLTEDRTIKYDFEADDALARGLSACTDQAIIETALSLEHREKKIEADLDYLDQKPSEAFARAVVSLRGRSETFVPAKAALSVARPINEIDPQSMPASNVSDAEMALLIKVMSALDMAGCQTKHLALIPVGVLPGDAASAARKGRLYLAKKAFADETSLAHALIRGAADIKGGFFKESWLVDRLAEAYPILAAKAGVAE